MKITFSNSRIKKTGNVGLLNVTNGTFIKYVSIFDLGEGSKIEEKYLMDRYKKMLTWGRGLSKIEKKSTDVLYGWPLRVCMKITFSNSRMHSATQQMELRPRSAKTLTS